MDQTELRLEYGGFPEDVGQEIDDLVTKAGYDAVALRPKKAPVDLSQIAVLAAIITVPVLTGTAEAIGADVWGLLKRLVKRALSARDASEETILELSVRDGNTGRRIDVTLQLSGEASLTRDIDSVRSSMSLLVETVYEKQLSVLSLIQDPGAHTEWRVEQATRYDGESIQLNLDLKATDAQVSRKLAHAISD